MKRGVLTALVLLGIAAGALALRLAAPECRPMHTDEANHAGKFAEFCRGRYRYDPTDFHGPTLYEFTLPSHWLAGSPTWAAMTEAPLRAVPAVFGALLVLAAGGLAAGLGRRAAVAAGLLTALSPAMVYTSRCYIQEMLLVAFTAGLLVAGWRYARRPGLGWAAAAGVAAGLMHATKETGVLALGAMLLAAATVWWWRRREPALPGAEPRVRVSHIAAGIIAAAATAALFLSGFGMDPAAPLRSLGAFARQGGSGIHDQPWHYYLGLVLWSRSGGGPVFTEALILALAAVGAVAALRGRRGGAVDPWLGRFLVVYTLLLTAFYAAIAHKTPWSMLSFHHGMILLAGVGAVVLWSVWPGVAWRVACAALLVAGGIHLGWQAHRSAFRFAADPRNPYVYAQTVPDTVRLGRRVEELAALHPDGASMRVHVIAPGADYWPLPWYLRRLDRERIGYWSEVPAAPDAPVVIASAALDEPLKAALRGDYHRSVYGLRPDVLMALHVRRDLWDRFLATRR